MRNERYAATPSPFRHPGRVRFRDAARRVVDVGALQQDTRARLHVTLTSASFGLQMVEGVEEVVFHRA